jgi:hypothetical protein
METPHIPLGERYKSLGYSMLTIIWWVGVWGLSESIMTLLFKESIVFKLGLYLLMIAAVFLVILFDPTMIKNL